VNQQLVSEYYFHFYYTIACMILGLSCKQYVSTLSSIRLLQLLNYDTVGKKRGQYQYDSTLDFILEMYY